MTGKIEPRKKLNRGEAKVQAAIIKMLERNGWFVRETHGNWFQSGFPDLYAVHQRYAPKWIEVKDPDRAGKSSLFTPAQKEVFPQWSARGVGIWVLTGATDSDYRKLFDPPNWHTLYTK